MSDFFSYYSRRWGKNRPREQLLHVRRDWQQMAGFQGDRGKDLLGGTNIRALVPYFIEKPVGSPFKYALKLLSRRLYQQLHSCGLAQECSWPLASISCRSASVLLRAGPRTATGSGCKWGEPKFESKFESLRPPCAGWGDGGQRGAGDAAGRRGTRQEREEEGRKGRVDKHGRPQRARTGRESFLPSGQTSRQVGEPAIRGQREKPCTLSGESAVTRVRNAVYRGEHAACGWGRAVDRGPVTPHPNTFYERCP